MYVKQSSVHLYPWPRAWCAAHDYAPRAAVDTTALLRVGRPVRPDTAAPHMTSRQSHHSEPRHGGATAIPCACVPTG